MATITRSTISHRNNNQRSTNSTVPKKAATSGDTAAHLTGHQKTAVLLLALGVESAAHILRELDAEDIERVTTELAQIKNVSAQITHEVIEEFCQMARTHEQTSTGGMRYAQDVLEQSLGKSKAADMLARFQGLRGAKFFTSLNNIDPRFLLDSLRPEHPQTIAIVLSHLETKTSAAILTGLPQEIRSDVVIRIATMDKTNPETIHQIEEIFNRRLASILNQQVSISGGNKVAANILNAMDRTSERAVFDILHTTDPSKANDIRKLMFTFDDLILVDDRGIQRILKDVEQKELALAMKTADPEVTTKIFKNLSERAGALLKEEISYLGPVKLRDVESAQQQIIAIVRRLEDAGEIIVQGRGGNKEETLLV